MPFSTPAGLLRTSAIVVLTLAIAGEQGAAADDQKISDSVARYCKELKDKDSKVRIHAAVELGKLGVKAKSAIPELMAVYRDQDHHVKGAAAYALGQMGSEALPAIRQALTDKDYQLRIHAIWALANFNPAPKEVDPLLAAQLNDPEVGHSAARALATVGEPGIRLLLEAATHKNPEMRDRVAYGLSRAKGKPKEATAALIELLKDKEPAVRNSAAGSLIWYGPRAEAAVPLLVQALREKDMHDVAPDALARIGPAAVPPVIEALGDKDIVVQVGACRTLALMGPKRSSSYSSPDDLPTAPLKLRPAVAPLVEHLKAKDQLLRYVAVAALGALGNEAGAAEGALIAALGDMDRGMRNRVAFALRNIEPKTEAAIAPLIAALKDDFDPVRNGAAQALGSMGPMAKAAVEPLIPLLQDKAGFVPSAAATALGNIRAEPRKAVPALILALKRDDTSLRWACLDALGKFGPDAKEAVPAILPLLKERDFRGFAADALNKIDPEAAKKAGVLEPLK